jgi:hypothetical protein
VEVLFVYRCVYSICSSLSRRRSAHLVSTMFGILSGPGALYGLILRSCLSICSLVMWSTVQHGSCSTVSSCVVSVGSFFGKKHLARALPFFPFVVAFTLLWPDLCTSIGILLFPPSVGCKVISLFTVQMSGSSALSSQSHQCCLFVVLRVLW